MGIFVDTDSGCICVDRDIYVHCTQFFEKCIDHGHIQKRFCKSDDHAVVEGTAFCLNALSGRVQTHLLNIGFHALREYDSSKVGKTTGHKPFGKEIDKAQSRILQK